MGGDADTDCKLKHKKRGLNRGRVSTWSSGICVRKLRSFINHSGLHAASGSVAPLIRILKLLTSFVLFFLFLIFFFFNHEDKRMDLPSFGVRCAHSDGCRYDMSCCASRNLNEEFSVPQFSGVSSENYLLVFCRLFFFFHFFAGK